MNKILLIPSQLPFNYRSITVQLPFNYQVYGNEPEIGEVFSKVFSEGVIKREDVFITSKLWNTFHRAEEVIYQCF